ncbi:hypothetical protein G9U88_001811 [Staphylococcus pseudintermedius]|nr:hypothetical protein [Staphylococcus pseudintermedius]
MEKQKMLSIANKLNLYVALSDVEAFVEFRRRDDSFSIFFVHFDKRYTRGNRFFSIYDWQSDEIIESLFNKAKNVIAGRALLDE